MRAFDRLVARRWAEAGKAVGFDPARIDLLWGVGDNYPHFKKKRGYGVTFWEGKPPAELYFSTKILRAPKARQDAIVRHEIGHVVDLLVPTARLDRWAAARGYSLAATEEQRVDDIAEAIWGSRINYDRNLIQTLGRGTYPRPRSLPRGPSVRGRTA